MDGSRSENKHPQTLNEAVLTRGVIDAIAYAANHPGVVCEFGSDEYTGHDWVPCLTTDTIMGWCCLILIVTTPLWPKALAVMHHYWALA